MPKAKGKQPVKKAKKFHGKKRNFRGAPNNNYITGAHTTQSLFPRNKKVAQRWVSRQILNISPSEFSGYTRDFRANSLVDIEKDNAATVRNAASDCQVWFLGYEHFTVIGCKATVHFNLKGGETKNLVVGVRLNSASDRILGNGTTGESVAQDMRSSKTGKTLMLTPEKPSGSITLNYSAKKEFGGSIMGNVNLRGSTTIDGVSGRPLEATYFQVMASGSDPGSPPLFEYHVVMEYLSVYTEPKSRGFNTLPAPTWPVEAND